DQPAVNYCSIEAMSDRALPRGGAHRVFSGAAGFRTAATAPCASQAHVIRSSEPGSVGEHSEPVDTGISMLRHWPIAVELPSWALFSEGQKQKLAKTKFCGVEGGNADVDRLLPHIQPDRAV